MFYGGAPDECNVHWPDKLLSEPIHVTEAISGNVVEHYCPKCAEVHHQDEVRLAKFALAMAQLRKDS